jgi:DNA polymerase-1
MIAVNKKLKGSRAKLVLQVHDELIVEAPKEMAEEIRNMVVSCMEDAIKLSVLLKVDANIGSSWLEAK